MTDRELRESLDRLLVGERPHAERIASVVAVLAKALERRGSEVTVVGGSALELHAPGIYATRDIDVVIEGGIAEEIRDAFRELGFESRGRHWVRGDLFIEVVGRYMSDPVDEIRLGDLTLRVISKEVTLADRVIGFKWWRYTEYGAQAVDLIRSLEGSLDQHLLEVKLHEQQAVDAYEALRDLASSTEEVSAETLSGLLDRLHAF